MRVPATARIAHLRHLLLQLSESWKLSDFKIDRCESTDSAFDFRVWEISEETMLDIITRKLCDAESEAASGLVSECTEVLSKLRSMFVWFEQEDILKALPACLHHAPAIHYATSTQPNCRDIGVGWSEVSLSDYADIAVFRSAENIDSVSSWLFHVELKSPFAGRPRYSSKHPLFGQSEVIAQRNGLKPVLGCLTNF